MGRPLRYLISAVLGLGLGILGAGGAMLAAQSLAPGTPVPSCEAQLDQAQRTIIQLRKANAQSDFRSASLEEALLDAQKKATEQDAKGKAAEKK